MILTSLLFQTDTVDRWSRVFSFNRCQLLLGNLQPIILSFKDLFHELEKKEEPKFKATMLKWLTRCYAEPYPANEARNFQ